MLKMGYSEETVKETVLETTSFTSSEIDRTLAKIKANDLLKAKYPRLDKAGINELGQFIEKQSKAGISSSDLIKSLVGVGWDEKIIRVFVAAYGK